MLIVQLVQQKDGIQTELTRTSLAKTKLESLCRELQKHSKAVVVSWILVRPYMSVCPCVSVCLSVPDTNIMDCLNCPSIVSEHNNLW